MSVWGARGKTSENIQYTLIADVVLQGVFKILLRVMVRCRSIP